MVQWVIGSIPHGGPIEHNWYNKSHSMCAITFVLFPDYVWLNIELIVDAKKQSQMASLSKERDNIQSAIRVYKSMFETQEQLINELRSEWTSHASLTILSERDVAHGAIGRRIDPSWGWTHWAISRSSQCSTTGVNKGCGMYYPVCGMVHIKEPLLLINKSSLCGGSRFPFSLSEWSLTICLTPYNRR